MIINSAPMSRSVPRITIGPDKSSARNRALRAVVFCLAWTIPLALGAQAQELASDTLRLNLSVTPEGIPIIEQGVWQGTGQTAFRDLGTPKGLSAWVPASLIPATLNTAAVWTITEGDDLTTAEATCELANEVLITWVVELPKRGQLFRVHIRLTNNGKRPQTIDTFPIWSATWDVGEKSEWVRSWSAIEYTRAEQTLSDDAIRFGSRLHSSDDVEAGRNPYWVVGGSGDRVYFGLQWCGGWSTSLQGFDNGFRFSVGLPSNETQLELGRKEAVDGPALLVMPTTLADDADARSRWMLQRQSFGRLLYEAPAPSFPLTYNHWYAVRRQLDDAFLNSQIAAMAPYTFDAFVIDAGWFAAGRWKPDPEKVEPGVFVEALSSLRASGIKPGLWSTPQYLTDTGNVAGLTIEDPPVSSRFLAGDLVDLSQDELPDYFAGHVQRLREKYSIDYWKYDQPFFTDQSRAGVMKNVIGFQNAMRYVRQQNPDLFIENCQNGGRMINEFTLLTTQTTWLKDLGHSGTPDPRDNISTALNALDFVFPWSALRFTINLDDIDPNDDESLRLYCRSAMAGVWGISSDLSAVTARQQNIVLTEIQNYRHLNILKYACEYDLSLPGNLADVAGVTFYSRRRLNSAVLLYRWQRDGAFDQRVMLSKLRSSQTYHVVDVDTGTEFTANGSDLISNGITIPFSSQRLSALVFIEAVTNSQPSTPAQ